MENPFSFKLVNGYEDCVLGGSVRCANCGKSLDEHHIHIVFHGEYKEILNPETGVCSEGCAIQKLPQLEEKYGVISSK